MIRVCDTCIGDNLLRSIGIQKCLVCKQPFCIHYKSKEDNSCCMHCLDGLTVTVEEEIRTVKKYKINGYQFVLVQRAIRQMSDPELLVAYELRREECDLMLNEIITRRAEKAHQGLSVKIPTPGTPTLPIQAQPPKSRKISNEKKLQSIFDQNPLLKAAFEAMKKENGGS